MKINTFYIVTMPTKQSTESDICFSVDTLGLQRQFLGGLKSEEIDSIYDNEKESKERAWILLDAVNAKK